MNQWLFHFNDDYNAGYPVSVAACCSAEEALRFVALSELASHFAQDYDHIVTLYEWQSNYDDDEYHDDDIMTFRCEMARANFFCSVCGCVSLSVNGVGVRFHANGVSLFADDCVCFSDHGVWDLEKKKVPVTYLFSYKLSECQVCAADV
jgi:hypothetical protein